jgi:Fe-S cluster biosynthesis and repair protein YggX
MANSPQVTPYNKSSSLCAGVCSWRGGEDTSFEEGSCMAHMVFCAKYKAQMEGLDETPFDSDFGRKIYDNVSKKAWGEWVEHQKMLLNEYRLQPWTREAQEFLVEQMQQFFFGEGAALPKEFVPPAQG